ncbi:hypothetical protein [Lacihabitans sp. LS3-19]|uniref:hypothetical protein n=1 Tax=Lacihabitans sp. LS3-19 TaxID=2487335 RepID=UPI0020CF2BFD|nr:hypothetical protein [Lacihabitans sp. LS3-19]
MNTSLIKTILSQAAVFVILIMLISFVLDTGVDRLTKEFSGQLMVDWFNSILTFGKMGLWILISVVYSYFRTTQIKK